MTAGNWILSYTVSFTSPFRGGSASITVRELTQIRDAGYEIGHVLNGRGSHIEAHKGAGALKSVQAEAFKKHGMQGVVKAAIQQRERQKLLERRNNRS